MDENVQPSFRRPGDQIERLMYGSSTLVCLPDGMSHPGSVGTGTVMLGWTSCAPTPGRPAFVDLEVLPIENDVFRFYRLFGL